MSTVDDVRKLLQDLIAPDLGALKEGQNALKEGLQHLYAELKLVREEIGASEGRMVREVTKNGEELAASEVRLMREIKNTQETLMLHLKSLQQDRITALTRDLEQMKRRQDRLGTGAPAFTELPGPTASEHS